MPAEVGHRHLVIENLALKGWVISAIRCGDGTGEQDHERAEAGAAAAGA